MFKKRGRDAIEKVRHTTARADLRRGAELGGTGFGGTDIPVGQTTSNLKPQTSNLAPGLFSTLAAAFLPTQAHAWSGGAAELDRLHFFHTDHLGSTRVVTDAVGAVFERIDYLPFGEIFRDDTGCNNCDYEKHRNKFTGQMWDYLTGLYYYGARYYDPEMGRFSQADTMVPRPLDSQTFNRYSYVNNNPYKYVDPSGHNALGSFMIGLVEMVVVAAAVAIGSMIGGAGLGILFGALVSGAINVISAAIAGATGGALAGAFMQGFVMSGFASSPIGPILAAYGIYQAVASNDPEAMAAILGSLIGNRIFSTLSSAGGEARPVNPIKKAKALSGIEEAIISSNDIPSTVNTGNNIRDDIYAWAFTQWATHNQNYYNDSTCNNCLSPFSLRKLRLYQLSLGNTIATKCNMFVIDALVDGGGLYGPYFTGERANYLSALGIYNLGMERKVLHPISAAEAGPGDVVAWISEANNTYHVAIVGTNVGNDRGCFYAGAGQIIKYNTISNVNNAESFRGITPVYFRIGPGPKP